MTKEEREKAIDALKMSVPFIPITPEEFDDYIKTLNQVIDWLDHNPCEDVEAKKIDEWEIHGENVELWVVKGNLQVRYLGTIHNIPLPLVKRQETITEFADRCRECGAKYGKMLDQETKHLNIPFLMHKELEIPISECQKAYEVAIDYLRSQADVRG